MSDDQLRQAISLVKAGDKPAGERLLFGILKKEPLNELAWLELSECYDQLEKKNICLNWVLRINPYNQTAQRRLNSWFPPQLALSFIKADDKPTGERLLIDLLKKEPLNELAWLGLSACYDDVEKKKICWNWVLRINPNNRTAQRRLNSLYPLHIARSLIKAGDKQGGERLLIDLLKKEPLNELAWLELSECYDQLEKKNICLKWVLKIDPNHKTAQRRLNSWFPPQLALSFNKADDKPTGERLLIDLLKKEPLNELAWLGLEACYDDLEKKKICLNWVLRINPNNKIAKLRLYSLSHIRRAISLIKAGDKQGAERLLFDLLKKEPLNKLAWFGLEGCYDDVEKKIICLKWVLRIDPSNQTAQRGLDTLSTPMAKPS